MWTFCYSFDTSSLKCEIADLELKNIIDKLANFVARNGPEFEQMTKQKQKDNAKFSFLFAGEYFNYYQYRVTTEQAGKFYSDQTFAPLTVTSLTNFPGLCPHTRTNELALESGLGLESGLDAVKMCLNMKCKE